MKRRAEKGVMMEKVETRDGEDIYLSIVDISGIYLHRYIYIYDFSLFHQLSGQKMARRCLASRSDIGSPFDVGCDAASTL